MKSKVKLWVARLLKRLIYRLEQHTLSPCEIKDYFESMFFSCYFPQEAFPDGPPPSLNTTKNPYRERILKGIGPAVIVKKTRDTERTMEIWIEDEPTFSLVKRKGWGDLNNTRENLIKRGVIKKCLEPS